MTPERYDESQARAGRDDANRAALSDRPLLTVVEAPASDRRPSARDRWPRYGPPRGRA